MVPNYHYSVTTIKIKTDQHADALKVVNIALTDNPQDIKLLLKKSEIETMIRTGTNNAPPVKVRRCCVAWLIRSIR